MVGKKLEDFTEGELFSFITKISTVNYPSEAAHNEAVYEFARITEYPDGWDIIYHPEPGADNSTQGIINTLKEWRAANGKSGFKSE